MTSRSWLLDVALQVRDFVCGSHSGKAFVRRLHKIRHGDLELERDVVVGAISPTYVPSLNRRNVSAAAERLRRITVYPTVGERASFMIEKWRWLTAM